MKYNYNMYRNYNNMYSNDRFIAGGFFAPLLIGGIAGYAIGNNGWGNKNNNNCCMIYPYPYYYPYNQGYPINLSKSTNYFYK